MLRFGNILKHKFGEAYEAEVKEFDAEVWSRDWSWFWINIGVRMCDMNWKQLFGVIWVKVLNLGSAVPFAMFTLNQLFGKVTSQNKKEMQWDKGALFSICF